MPVHPITITTVPAGAGRSQTAFEAWRGAMLAQPGATITLRRSLGSSPVDKPERKPPADPEGLLTAAEAAARLGITIGQLKAHVADGAIRYINVGRGKQRARYRFAPADLDAFKTNRTTTEQPSCPFSSPKSPRRTIGSASKSSVVGFTALRAAHLARKPKGSKR
jgi:hypothetical protein